MKIISNLVEAHIIKIVNGKPNYLLLKRSPSINFPNIWQMVTGKVEKGEKAYHAVVREIKEETELSIERLYVVPKVNSFYNSYDDSINLIPIFVAKVDSNSFVRISSEHQSFKWVNKKEALKMLPWPGQIDALKIIHNFFTNKSPETIFVEIKL